MDTVREKTYTIKEAAPDSGYHFEGYLSTYENVDRDGDTIKTGAFAESIKKKSTRPMCFNHNRNVVLGRLDLAESLSGVYVKGVFNLDDPQAENVYKLLKMGALDSMSVGFIVEKYSLLEPDRPWGPWEITKGDILEGSVVTAPANEKAEITDVKNADGLPLDAIKKAVEESLKAEKRRQAIISRIGERRSK